MMPELDIVQKTMLENWRHQRLPHFCLISANESEADKLEVLKNWTNHLLSEIWKCEGKNLAPDWQTNPSFLQHPDFTQVEIEGPSALLSSQPVIDLLAQIDYRPMELRYKWIIWHEAEKINTALANRLLKTLEEPPEKTIILFTTTEKAPLLPTIESRAIKIRLPKSNFHDLGDKPQASESLVDFLERLGKEQEDEFMQNLSALLRVGEIHETLEFIKKHKLASHQLMLHILDYERTQAKAPQALEALNKRIQWFQKAQTFNQGAAERWLTLLSPYL